MQRDVIRNRVHVFQSRQPDPLLFRYRDRHKRIVPYQFHPKRARPPRYFHSDSPQAHDAQRLSAQLSPLQRFLLPLARVHQRVRAA